MKKTVLLLSFLIFFVSTSIAGQEPLLTLSVENSLFSPSAKIKEGVVFKIKVEGAKKIKLWFLEIRNAENNKKVKEIISKESIPEKVVWDGLDEAGEPVPDGQYAYKLFVKTDKGSKVMEDSDLLIDSTPPFVSLKCAQDIYFINEEGKFGKNVIIYLSGGDESFVNYSKSYLEILSYRNKVIKEFPFKNKIPEFLTWDGEDDVYGLTVPIGNYKIHFVVTDKAGNASKIDSEISVVNIPKEPELPKEEVEVKQEERGLVINLSSKVLFDVSKSELKPEAEKSLNEVAAILRVYPKNKVHIEGHTDSSGIEAKNTHLSVQRAESVYNFLAGQGIDKDRMQVLGLGSSRPVASNDTAQGKEQNRRVEIVILKTEAEVKPDPDAKDKNKEELTDKKPVQEITIRN